MRFAKCSVFPSYVIEDGSPYVRSGKQNSSSTSGRRNPGETRDVVDDLGDDMWNFMSFCKKDVVRDSIPDQQLSLQDLTVRYKGEFTMSRRLENVFKWTTSFLISTVLGPLNISGWIAGLPLKNHCPLLVWSYIPSSQDMNTQREVTQLCHCGLFEVLASPVFVT